MTGAKTVERPPTLHDAARRGIVRFVNGTTGRLVGVSAKGVANVVLGGRHVRVSSASLVLVGFDGDVELDGRLILCGACGAIDSEACSPRCPRRDTGRDDEGRFR
jgi:hypothetical protein